MIATQGEKSHAVHMIHETVQIRQMWFYMQSHHNWDLVAK